MHTIMHAHVHRFANVKMHISQPSAMLACPQTEVHVCPKTCVDVQVHDCGPIGNDCHLAGGALAEDPLTSAEPKVEGDFYAVTPRHFNIMRR